MIILYVDDCIIVSKTKEEADAIFNYLINKGLKIIDERAMGEYLGIVVTHGEDVSFRISQLHLIDRIIESISGMKYARSSTIPASVDVILTKNVNEEIRKEHSNYRSSIVMLNYLVNCTHPNILFSVHQCARFFHDPRHRHEQAVKTIISYLIVATRNYNTNKQATQGIVYRPDKTKSIDTYGDASFAGD